MIKNIFDLLILMLDNIFYIISINIIILIIFGYYIKKKEAIIIYKVIFFLQFLIIFNLFYSMILENTIYFFELYN